MARFGDWLHERTGWRNASKVALEEPVPGGARYAYVFGSVLTFVLILQATTGVFLAMTYSPSQSAAWASVAYIQDQSTMGWFVRGLHSYGASAMVIVAGLHLFQTTLYGAYKKPREVNWIVGATMFALILAFALTGYLLPWDQKGYWATKVATGIMGETPVIGQWLQHLIQGGNEYGNLTLTRFYSIHVFLLPAGIFGLLGIHLILFRKHGITPHWKHTGDYVEPFWPNQLLKDMVAICFCFAIMAFLVVRSHGAALEAPADPSSGFDARPEWYFLPLFQLLKYFHGVWERVIALGLPAVVGGVLLGMPFVDTKPDRSPVRRAPFVAAILVGYLGAGALIGLAKHEDASDAKLQKRLASAEKQAQKARTLALQGVPPAGGVSVYENEPHHHARELFAERCAGCHRGTDRKAPILDAGYDTRPWIRGYLSDPNDPKYFGLTHIHTMKPVKYTGAELDALVEWIYAQTGATDADKALADKGQTVFDAETDVDENSCTDCHQRDGTSHGSGPNLGGRGTVEWLRGLISDPSAPPYFGDKNDKMPAFSTKLKPEEIAELADYVAWLRTSSETEDETASAASAGK